MSAPSDVAVTRPTVNAGTLATADSILAISIDRNSIVETVLFALSRPRHVTLGTIIFDPDIGGIH